MDGTKTRPFDAARYLTTPEARAEYLSAMMTDNDPAAIRHALGTVARARGMGDLARDAGLGPKSLYKALGEGGNPELGTVLKVLGAMGLTLAVEVAPGAAMRVRPHGEDDIAGTQPAPSKPVRSPRKASPPRPADAPAKPAGPGVRKRAAG